MKLTHFVEAQQLTPKLLYSFFQDASELRGRLRQHSNDLDGKVLASLFYEPSTRTRLSFETAMLRLGGQIISTENAKEFSSAIKGETIEDTIRVVGGYADCIVLRHYEDGTAKIASEISSVPIINAGDGKGQHPSQALLDVYTIYKELGRMDNFRIAMVGDLASGRTARSLCYLLGKFKGIESHNGSDLWRFEIRGKSVLITPTRHFIAKIETDKKVIYLRNLTELDAAS